MEWGTLDSPYPPSKEHDIYIFFFCACVTIRCSNNEFSLSSFETSSVEATEFKMVLDITMTFQTTSELGAEYSLC